MNETITKSAEALLNEPKRFYLPTHGLLRWIGIKKIRFSVKGLYLGTLVKITSAMKGISIDTEKSKVEFTFHSIEMDTPAMARIVAMAILNSRLKIRLLTGPLSRFLTWRMTAKELNLLMLVVMEQMNLMDFFSSIVLIGNLNMIGRKEKTSPAEEGSQIAPGGPSAES